MELQQLFLFYRQRNSVAPAKWHPIDQRHRPRIFIAYAQPSDKQFVLNRQCDCLQILLHDRTGQDTAWVRVRVDKRPWRRGTDKWIPWRRLIMKED